MIDQRNVALGTDKSDTLKVAYGEKDVINQLEFLKVPTIGDILVVINQAGGVFVRKNKTKHIQYTTNQAEG